MTRRSALAASTWLFYMEINGMGNAYAANTFITEWKHKLFLIAYFCCQIVSVWAGFLKETGIGVLLCAISSSHLVLEDLRSKSFTLYLWIQLLNDMK